jgi:hypothetical protein
MNAARRLLVFAVASVLPAVGGCKANSDDVKAQYERELVLARALVKTDGCTSASNCAAAEVGLKACGGPREYWVYCKTTTDEKALLDTLTIEKDLERNYLEQTGNAGDCLAVVKPDKFVLSGTSCQVAVTP